jgi:fibronectin type 3 domain-containing protein
MSMKWFVRLLFALVLLAIPVHAQQTATQPISITIVQHQTVLNWTASVTSGVVGYDVYRSTTNGGPYTQINGGNVTALTYIDLTVIAGTTYYYVVTAIASDNSTQSVNSNQCTSVIPTP